MLFILSMKHIVILGGGFAGVAAGISLTKHKLPDTKITLIDKNGYHLFTPSLYEAATSETSTKNIAIPFKEIFDGKMEFIQDIITKIDTSKKIITTTKQKNILYDYLLISLGSESAFHNIPGLKENAISLKSIEEAIAIKDKIKLLCCKEGQCNRKVNVIIGGGGFSGTELAEELLTYNDKLAKQHHLAKDCMDITIIQGSDRLLKELDSHVSDLAQKRINNPQVHFAFGGHIAKVTKTIVFTDNKKEYPFDIFIWTGGVMPNHIIKDSQIPVTPHNQIEVNDFLQAEKLEHVFSAGDIAQYIDPKTQRPAPGVAQVAEEQGSVAGENLYKTITKKPLVKYKYRHFGYIVPMRGRFASAELMYGIHLDGFLGWVLQQLVFFRYMLTILPFWKAFRKWDTFEVQLKQ